MSNETICTAMQWSERAANILKPLFSICIAAAVIHLLFWFSLIAYSSIRQRSMQWLYAYLFIDLLLLIRFFLLYIYRWSPLCIPHLLRTIICYYEAIFDNYLNLLQSYILLALNICRYYQIARNCDVYLLRRRTIVLTHLFIYILPLLCYIIAIVCHWFVLHRPQSDACDLDLRSLTIQIVFLLVSYMIPIVLTLLFLLLSLKHVRNTDGIRTQQIIDARLKYHRRLVIQSSVFYSFWLLLWSPYLLLFPFYYRHSMAGSITQMFSYIGVALDPIIIAALDVRFLRAWHSTWKHFMKYVKPVRVAPMPVVLLRNQQLKELN